MTTRSVPTFLSTLFSTWWKLCVRVWSCVCACVGKRNGLQHSHTLALFRRSHLHQSPTRWLFSFKQMETSIFSRRWMEILHKWKKRMRRRAPSRPPNSGQKHKKMKTMKTLLSFPKRTTAFAFRFVLTNKKMSENVFKEVFRVFPIRQPNCVPKTWSACSEQKIGFRCTKLAPREQAWATDKNIAALMKWTKMARIAI